MAKSHRVRLEVHQAYEDEVRNDYIRVGVADRGDLSPGRVVLVKANGRESFAILQGLAATEAGWVRLDDGLRKKLTVEESATYEFEFRDASRKEELEWARNASNVAYRIGAEVAVRSYRLGWLSFWLGLLSLALGVVAFCPWLRALLPGN